MSLVTSETHQRLHSRSIDRHELKRLVIGAVLDELGIKRDDPNVEATVKFEDVKEGGSACPYTVGTKALVVITEDLEERMKPVAKVINNNQPGWTNIVETAPGVTLPIGTELCLPPGGQIFGV